MGIHIKLVKFKGFEKYENLDLAILEGQSNFDSLRYAGDTAFNNEIDWEYLSSKDSGEILKRPKNISETKNWVLENIHIGNQSRLLFALSKMEDDKNIFFEIIY